MKTKDVFPSVGAPALRALASINVINLADLTRYTEKKLLALHGFGPKALALLRQALKDNGLSFSKE